MPNASIDGKQSDDSSAAVVTTMGNSGAEQGILARDLMTGLMGLIPILGGKKVTVGFAGGDAFCDSTFSYVNIPALPQTNVIPIQIAREIRGFAAHEAAHIAFTDESLFPSSIFEPDGSFKPGCDKLLKEIWNCVEDFMIERHWLELYPGSRKNFAATETRCCRSYMEGYGQNPDCAKDLRVVGPVALTWLRAMHFVLGTTVSRESFETLSPAFQQRVIGWWNEIEDVETTQDCLDAAWIIHADIMADPYDPNDPPANPSPQQGGQGQGGQGQGQGQGQAGSNASGPGGASGAADDPNGSNSGPDPIPTSSKIDQTMNDAGADADAPEWVSAEVLSTAANGPMAKQLADPGGHQRSMEASKNVQSAMAATSTQLNRALKSAAKDRWKGGRMDGRLDRSRLANVRMGSSDVYRRKIKGDVIDTAVEILVDCSGSMNGEEIQICQQLALILESAFSGTKIKHEIIGFTTADIGDADPAFQTMTAAHQKRGSTLQARAIGLYEFRKYGQPHSSALQTIGNMTEVGMGSTPTSDAILLAHDRLARRPERRHVMFVLTDGDADDNKECKKAVKAVEKCGVTVIGIGIGTGTVKKSFTNHAVLKTATDLPALMMSQISSMLIGDKNKVGLKGLAVAQARKV